MLIILALSSSPNLIQQPIEFISIDKIGHIIFYGILTMLMLNDLNVFKGLTKLAIGTVLLIASSYGIMLEFVQAALPYRMFDYADMIANFIGVFTGCFLYLWHQRKNIDIVKD